MSNTKNSLETDVPMLLPEEYVLYETKSRKGIFAVGRDNIRVTNRRLLIIKNKEDYRSLFYDKVVSLDVKRGLFRNKLKINMLGSSEPGVLGVSRRDAPNLFSVISNTVSLSSDSRLAYAIGTLDATHLIEREREMTQEIGSKMIMQQYLANTAETRRTNVTSITDLGLYHKEHAISMEAKNSDGKKLDVNFNFVPKVKNIVSSRLNSEALYTLANGMYSGSAIVAGLLYGTAKNARATLSATMASTLKQSIKEDYLRNVQGLRCVALSNIQRIVELEGDPMAYADLRHFADVAVDEFTSDVYHDLGTRLAGLDHYEELINKTHEAEGHVVEQAHDVESKHVVNTDPMAGMLRTARYEQTLSGSPETGVITHVGQQVGNSSSEAKQKWKPEEELLIFRLREHKNKNRKSFVDLIKQNPSS
jgi:hypothetical protein